MTDKSFFPIILGSDENAYGTARIFNREYGIKPLLLCTRLLVPTQHSRLFTVKIIDNFSKNDVFVRELSKILRQYKEKYEKLVVVSCSDYYTALMSENYEKFEGLVSNPFPEFDLLEKLDTKDRFYAMCEQHGIDYPETVVADTDERLSALDKLTFGFPIVVKPENSNAKEYLDCEFNGKKKVFFFDTAEEYLEMVKEMNKSGYSGKLIIQRFIKGDDSAMRVMNCYSDKNGKVRAMCLGQPVLEEYHPKSLGNYAAIISRCDDALYKKIKKFLEDIGYTGFSNFDMKYDAENGKYYLMEINPRPGRSSFYVYASGMNLMQCMLSDVFDENKECIFGQNTTLWANVSKYVMFKYTENLQIRAEMKKLVKEKKYMRTLDCKEDRNIKRFLKIKRYYLGQCRSYKKYYFKKG